MSRADCESADEFTFPLSVTAETSAVIEVWVGEGSADCKTLDARQTNPICTKIASKPGSSISNNTLTFKLSSKSIALGLSNVDGCTDSTGGTTSPRKASLFFLVITDASADVTDAATWSKTSVDLVGPTPPSGVKATSAENAISLSWDQGNDSDVQGYAFFCEASGAGTGGAGGGASSSSGGGGAGGGGAAGVTGTNGDCPSVKLGAGEIPPSDLQCGTVDKAGSGLTTTLDNGRTYAVGVAATDLVGNTGVLSEVQCATPAPVDDFFELYNAYGGQAGGGYCNCAAVGADRRAANPWASASLGALALLALRRRRSARALAPERGAR